MNYFVSSIFIDFDHNEVRRSDISQGFMDGELVVRKKGKRRMVGFLEYLNFKTGIPRTDTD